MQTARRIIVGTKLALFFAVLVVQPVLSQESSVLVKQHELAVRELIRTQVSPEYLEDLYIEAATRASAEFQSSIQPTLKRALSDTEKQRLYMFWYRKTKEMMSYPTLERILVPVFAKYLTLDEVQEINRFYATPVGKKLTRLQPELIREAGIAGEELVQKMSANEKWMNSTLKELQAEFPSWFSK